ARDKVKRNVVLLCEIPLGGTGRPSKSLKLPQAEALLDAAAPSAMCVDALREHWTRQDGLKRQAGSRWQDNDLVFPSRVGTPWDASHVRREFRKVVEAAGLDPWAWTPRELRHGFVSLMSDAAFRSSKSPGWSATAGPRQPRPSTASRSGLFSSRARAPWTV